MDIEELDDDISVCSECDKHTDDNIETKWGKEAEPYCNECFNKLMKGGKK